jgi:transposase
MSQTTIAVDVAKSVFEIAISDHPGRVGERQRLSRPQFVRFLAVRPPATVVLEACGMAHFWGRQAAAHGHRVLLLPPHTVRPYVPRNKTDRADATGLLEAVRNEAIHPVPLKSVAQQALTALHRLRSAWLATRTARINTLRGILREFGCTVPVGARHVVPRVEALLAAPDSPVPAGVRPVLLAVLAELRELATRQRAVEQQIAALAAETPVVARLRTIPGIGLLTATALVAFVGAVPRFPSARHFASYLGLTPRESSSGLRRRLWTISKRGDAYLRMLLIHGGRSVLWHAKTREHPGRLQQWALQIERQRGHNKAAVAVANKLARIAWAVWKTDTDFADVRPCAKAASVAC